jgi:Viral BACON domain
VEQLRYSSAFLSAPALSALRIESHPGARLARKSCFFLWCTALIAFFVIGLSLPAHAFPGGVSGYSGKNGTTCTSCHSSGTAPSITLTGPTSVTSGSTNSYTLTVGGSGNGGLDVAASAGTFTAGIGTQVLSGEITQTAATSTHSWTFSWTAPTVTATTTATLYAAAVDGFGGGTGALQQAITVTAAAPAPTLAVSPANLSFSYQSGGTTPSAQSVGVSSNGSALSYTVSTSATWLTATPSGSTPGTVAVSVNPSALAAGSYTGTVSIAASGASNTPQKVAVTLTVAAAQLPTLTATPASLSFTYQIGGSTPAAQPVSLTSSGSAVSFTATTSATWLGVTPTSGSTGSSVSVSVNPSGLAAGTYSGNVTITSSGASNSPKSIPVTLTVTSATSGNPSFAITPGSLSFSYTLGSTASGSQNLSVASTGTALSFTTAASGGPWLSVSPASGSTSATLKVSVSAAGMTAGTYNGSITVTSSSAANSPQTIPVKLVISSSTGSGRLRVFPSHAVYFDYQSGQSSPGAKNIRVTSSASPLSFTAAPHGATWLSVTPSGGTTPATLSVSADPTGLASGTYTATIQLTAQGGGGLNVPVVLKVVSSNDGGGEVDDGGSDDGTGSGATGSGGGTSDAAIHAWPYAYDPASTNSVAATWLDGTGTASTATVDSRQQGLLLSKTSAASNQAQAGVVLRTVEGMTLTELGYDIRNGGQCTAMSPRFVVVTSDDVVHKIGCSTGTSQPAPAAGWKRLRFDPTNPTQTSPVIQSGSKVKSIYLVLDGGPESGASLVVLDNIDINGTLIGKQ